MESTQIEKSGYPVLKVESCLDDAASDDKI